MTRVLVLSPEPVGERMAGPAIRALELARALARRCEVTLAAPPPSRAPLPLLEAGPADFDRLVAAFQEHDVVVAQQLPAQLLRRLRRLPARHVADLYNPLMIEVLEALDGSAGDSASAQRAALGVLAQCASADFIICASEKQRDLWLGALGVAGLLDVEAYHADPTYRSVIDVVPFGLPDEPPRGGRQRLKGSWPGIGEDDQVLIWGGGIWRWLDPLTPIRAIELLRDREPAVHLFFLGTERPSEEPADVPGSAGAAIAFARERGLEGERVHFNSGWVPYEERHEWLLSADLGVSAHSDHLEARFSFRTRVLDYLWAGLPVVTSGGDAIGDLVDRAGLGRSVAPGDAGGFADACAALLDDPAPAAARVRETVPGLRWSETVGPLADYCVNLRERRPPRKSAAVVALSTYGQYPALASHLRETRGTAEVARRVGRFLSRALRQRR